MNESMTIKYNAVTLVPSPWNIVTVDPPLYTSRPKAYHLIPCIWCHSGIFFGRIINHSFMEILFIPENRCHFYGPLPVAEDEVVGRILMENFFRFLFSQFMKPNMHVSLIFLVWPTGFYLNLFIPLSPMTNKSRN